MSPEDIHRCVKNEHTISIPTNELYCINSDLTYRVCVLISQICENALHSIKEGSYTRGEEARV